MRVYGLKNCDTCKKALKWLKDEGLEADFHDVRADGVSEAQIAGWAKKAGWEVLLNRRGTTWRGLSEAEKVGVDEKSAIALMAAHPALIKRPVFERGADVLVGFGKEQQAALKG